MRNFKIFLWIFIIFLIQTVILGHVHVLGAAPSLVMAYMMCIMIMENEFRSAVTISIICSFVMGALSGRDFIIITLFYAYGSIIVFALRKKPAYAHNAVKAVTWTFALSVLLEILLFLIANRFLNLHALFYIVLPTAVINAVVTGILYPILKKTMYKEEKKKLLIV